MECLGDQKRTMPGGQDMREEDILSALKLTSFVNSLFTLVSYKYRMYLFRHKDRPDGR